jgi:hypothetical protein
MTNRLRRGNTMDATNMWRFPGILGSDGVTRGDPSFRNVNDAFRNSVLSRSRSVSSGSMPSNGRPQTAQVDYLNRVNDVPIRGRRNAAGIHTISASSSVNPSDGGYSSASGGYQKPQIESDEEMMGWSGITFIIFMVIIFIGIIVFIISVIYNVTTGKSMFTGRSSTPSTDEGDEEELEPDKTG